MEDPCFDDSAWQEWRARFWDRMAGAEIKQKLLAKIDALIAAEKKQYPVSAEQAETGDYWWNRD